MAASRTFTQSLTEKLLISADSSFDNTTYSICAWIYPTLDIGGFQHILIHRLFSDSGCYGLAPIISGRGEFRHTSGVATDRVVGFPSDWNTAEWTFVTGTKISTTAKCSQYRYNTDTISTSEELSEIASTSGSGPISIGSNNGNNERFEGNIGYVAVFNTNLSDSQFQELRFNPFALPENLVVLIPVWGESLEIDRSGYGNDATPTGTTASNIGAPVFLLCGQ